MSTCAHVFDVPASAVAEHLVAAVQLSGDGRAVEAEDRDCHGFGRRLLDLDAERARRQKQLQSATADEAPLAQ